MVNPIRCSDFSFMTAVNRTVPLNQDMHRIYMKNINNVCDLSLSLQSLLLLFKQPWSCTLMLKKA